MSVVIRLRREGNKNNPYYRIVVTDSRVRRDGSFLDQVGVYDPKKKGQNFQLDLDKVTAWTTKGAKASETVASFIRKAKKAS
jgi:small subunit ribosomal protein S16